MNRSVPHFRNFAAALYLRAISSHCCYCCFIIYIIAVSPGAAKDAAKSIAALGVEVLPGDFKDKASLAAALKGAEVAFVVTVRSVCCIAVRVSQLLPFSIHRCW